MTSISILHLVNKNVYWPIIGHLYCITSFFNRHFKLLRLPSKYILINNNDTSSVSSLYPWYILHVAIFKLKTAWTLSHRIPIPGFKWYQQLFCTFKKKFLVRKFFHWRDEAALILMFSLSKLKISENSGSIWLNYQEKFTKILEWF